MTTYYHSVTLDDSKCKGCTNCIKKCPTEAIRVRKGKARITNERCIDCGECIRVCPYHAKKAITDKMEALGGYQYKIALPAPTLYGQFPSRYDRKAILGALKAQGFDEVFEVARGAEIVTEAVKKILMKRDCPKPLISSACPAVVRFIQVRFPALIDNLVKIDSPMEVSAMLARKRAAEQTGIRKDDIGVFFISPCAAKATSVKTSYERYSSNVNGVLSMADIYLGIVRDMESKKYDKVLIQAGIEGLRWAGSGGESLSLQAESYLSVDGIHNVAKILEDIENEKLGDIEFVEALSCTGGCLGGPLTVENGFVAAARLRKHLEQSRYMERAEKRMDYSEVDLVWQKKIEHKPVLKLDENLQEALRKMGELESINDKLPGLDCGACGAPSCRALAEDIVRGKSHETDCIFKLREKVRDLAIQMMELEGKMPPVMDDSSNGEEDLKK